MTIDTDLATLRAMGKTHIYSSQFHRDRYTAALDRVEAELARLRTHAAGTTPTRERIREYHSRLPADWHGWAAVREDHFAYHQGEEACYICTLLAALEAAERELARLREAESQARYYREKYEERAEELQIELARLQEGLRPEPLARLFHETYERLAPDHGYKTREDSAVRWEDVPAANRALMIGTADAVVRALLADTPDHASPDPR